MSEVADGIVAEYLARRQETPGTVTTIYFGGGTPSTLPLPFIRRIADALPTSHVEEFTVEVNPDDVTPDFISGLAGLGVNRISMGVQSLDDNVLRHIGRRHTAAHAIEALKIIRAAGICNISADLIYGLPGQTQAGWEHDLRTLLAAGITHLSAYCLTYHEGTPLFRMAKAGKIAPASDDELALRFTALRRITQDAGFRHYEISNRAVPGFESKHNSTYWSPDGKWLGLGPAAHSFDGKTRRYNPLDISSWLAILPNPSLIVAETGLDRLNDHIVTALRTEEGLNLLTIPPAVAQSLIHDAERFISQGCMTLSDNHLAIPPDLWLISDAFIREMIR